MKVRVFFNSPAEGELQRGDVILSINNHDSSQMTHKQAQDLIKHSGGQIQLVINRPPPGSQTTPLSPPIANQIPIASTYQSPPSPNPSSRILPIQMQEPSFFTAYDGPYQPPPHKPPHQPLHVYATQGPQYQHGGERQRSSYSQPPTTPTPTTPVPPWASQQFAPKRVSKLSKLGGGGFDFGTTYATMPRGTSGAQYGGRHYVTSQSSYDAPEEVEPDRLATGPIPKVCRLRDLGGGGYDFGSSFGSATLPRRTGRRLSQPVKMPSASGFGYQPSKTTVNRYGGGGQDFGSDFSQRGYGRQTSVDRVQTSLENIQLSPRTPDAITSNHFYQPYELSYQSPQQFYTPTGLLLEQQRLQEQQEEGEAIAPVWERRKKFQQGPSQNSSVRTPLSKPAPKIAKPRPGPTSYGSFGTDFTKPKQSTPSWRPTNQYKPSYDMAPTANYITTAVHYTPKPVTPAAVPKPSPPTPTYAPMQATRPAWQRQEEEDTGMPAWRSTLKSSGVKPWEMDTTNYAIEQQPVRSVPFKPRIPHTPNSAGSFGYKSAHNQGGSRNGPRVVHLQYNSPMQLYSRQNVAETMRGQTRSLGAGQT